jgi:hypothetical protein
MDGRGYLHSPLSSAVFNKARYIRIASLLYDFSAAMFDTRACCGLFGGATVAVSLDMIRNFLA